MELKAGTFRLEYAVKLDLRRFHRLRVSLCKEAVATGGDCRVSPGKSLPVQGQLKGPAAQHCSGFHRHHDVPIVPVQLDSDGHYSSVRLGP
jgi:hypothetical protein